MKKRSIKIAGHATSITLEDEFWQELQTIAQRQKKSVSKIIAEIDEGRGDQNLSSALRVFILKNIKS